MSDARAKAEARRAKILARLSEKNKVQVVEKDEEINEDKDSDVNKAKEEVKDDEIKELKKEKPLAARRKYISTPKSDSEYIPSNDDPSDDPGVESISEFEEMSKKNETIDNTVDTTSVAATSDKSPMTSSSTKEIENSIKDQTAEFDAKVLDKSKKKPKKIVKAPIMLVAPLQTSHVLKIVRILAIVVVGIVIGHRSVNFHSQRLAALSNQNSCRDNVCEPPVINFEEDHPDYERDENIPSNDLNILIASKSKYAFSSAVSDGTWIGWLRSYIIKQAESTISALGLAWWIARLFSPIVDSLLQTSLFKSSAPAKDGGILGKLLNIYASGIEGLIEGSLGTIGELALQLFVVLVTCIGLSYLHDGNLASASSDFSTFSNKEL